MAPIACTCVQGIHTNITITHIPTEVHRTQTQPFERESPGDFSSLWIKPTALLCQCV